MLGQLRGFPLSPYFEQQLGFEGIKQTRILNSCGTRSV
jgi:hypothetical protein